MQIIHSCLFVSALPILLPVVLVGADNQIGAEVLQKTYSLANVGGTLANTNTPQGATSGRITANGVGVYGDIALPTISALPEGGISLSLRYVRGDDDHFQTSSTGALGYVPVDGSGTSTGTGPFDHTFQSDVDELDIAAIVHVQVWGGDQAVLEVGGGPFYRSIEQRRRQSGVSRTTGAGTEGYLHLYDDLDTTTIGLILNGRLACKLTPAAGLFCAVQFELARANHEFKSDQRVLGTPYSASGSKNAFSPGYGCVIGFDYLLAMVKVTASFALESIETADVDHAVLNSNVYPSRIEEHRGANIMVTLGAAYDF